MKYLKYTYLAILVWLAGTMLYDLKFAGLLSQLLIIGGLVAFIAQTIRYFRDKSRL